MIERIEPLGPQHDRGAFSCGVVEIDDFLKAYNTELSAPAHRIYVAADEASQILGYYALRPAVWEARNKHGQRVSTVELELAMVGVAQAFQGKRLVGARLVFDAFEKVLDVVAITGGIERFGVGPLNDRCRSFYERAGFIQLDNIKRMYISIGEIADAFALE